MTHAGTHQPQCAINTVTGINTCVAIQCTSTTASAITVVEGRALLHAPMLVQNVPIHAGHTHPGRPTAGTISHACRTCHVKLIRIGAIHTSIHARAIEQEGRPAG